jgi:hypothetical protein
VLLAVQLFNFSGIYFILLVYSCRNFIKKPRQMNMVPILRSCLRNAHLFSRSSCVSSPQSSSLFTSTKFYHQEKRPDPRNQSSVNLVAAKVRAGSSPDEILLSLAYDKVCNNIEVSNSLVDKLLSRFKDDWKYALGVFRWARLRSGYKHRPKAYDMMVGNLGKMKQMDQMRAIRGNESKSSSYTQHCG